MRQMPGALLRRAISRLLVNKPWAAAIVAGSYQ